MTLKQVEAFYWAATLANFSRAAERLFLSQSSLSKRIAELEVQLGKPLFDRSGHRAALTPAGKTLLPLARRFMRAGNDLMEGMSESVQVRGICRFGMGELAALSWLPSLVASARAAYPELVMEPHVDLGQSLEQRVESGELDFAVVAGKSNRSALTSHVVARVNFRWVGAPSLVGTGRFVDQQMLQQVAVITMPAEAGSAREFDNWLIANGLDVERRLRCNNLSAIVGLVAAGVGISFLPDGWIEPLVQRGDLVRLESSPALPTLAYAFQARRDEVRPLVRQMRALVTREADFARPNRLL